VQDDRTSAGAQGRGLRVRWLGRVPYAEGWDLQRAVAVGSDDDYLLLMEHAPVYTLGSHADPSHVLVEPASVGATLLEVDRGGDVTYHGRASWSATPSAPSGVAPTTVRSTCARWSRW